MKKILLTLLICLSVSFSFADSILIEGFEYGNHDLQVPVGWICDDNSWLSGYLDKDHNRVPHTGNWYAFTDADDSWMFMEMFMSSQLKYRFFFWGISDGEYDVEFWAGSGPSTAEMTTLLFTKTVNDADYQQFAEYIETVAADYPYFGIHAIAHEGAYHLTIDDIMINMVNKYDFSATPDNTYLSLYPGQQTVFSFEVQNLGYEPIEVIISPYNIEYFENIHFTVDGTQCNTFHLEPDEAKKVYTEVTLLSTVPVGSTCWLDIHLVLDCNCATAMTTLWATVLDPLSITKHEPETEVQRVEVFDLTGKQVDPTNLKAGVYIERTISEQGVSTRKFVKQ